MKPQRVLVIEDNAANLKLLVFLLKSFGLEALSATNGRLGVEAALRERPDLILCDLQMPEMDGFEVLRHLDEAPGGRPAPVVALTAFAMVGDRERVLRAGFDGYLPKPINPATFVQQLEGFVAFRGSLEALSELPAGRMETPLRPERPPESPRAVILAVDDGPWNLELLRGVLQPRGYRVLTGASVEEGMALARQHQPDLILCDWHLGGTSGEALYTAVRAERELRDTPFAFLSMSSDAAPQPLPGARWFRRVADPHAIVEQVEEMLAAGGKAPEAPLQ